MMIEITYRKSAKRHDKKYKKKFEVSLAVESGQCYRGDKRCFE
jgi:hypothetical protein